jgi:hypothetical protein
MKKIVVICLLLAAVAVVGTQIPAHSGVPCTYSVSITPAAPVDFGSVLVNKKSEPQTFIVTNTSTCTPAITYFVGTQGDSGCQFDYDLTTCIGGTLAQGASCNAVLRFEPEEEKSYSGTFEVTVTAPETLSSSTVLTGTGTANNSLTALLLSQLGKDDSDGCNATASTGAAGGKSSGPAGLGLIALMGLVLGTATVRRRMRKS